MIQKNVNKLLNKPMNRREFLAHIGAGAMFIMGISGLLKGLVDFGGPRHHTDNGYGSSSYGGSKR